VLAYARRRLDSPQDAEDVVVEVFATAWRRRAEVPEEALPWLYATASNAILHVTRAAARRRRLGLRLASVPTGSEDPFEAVASAMSARSAVSAAFEELSASDAELLRLWAWEQLEPAEIAHVLGCTPGTARTRLHRARGRFREALSRLGAPTSDVCAPAAPSNDPMWPHDGSEEPR
jgi:RNA polymerase sigma-70 factor (ECF subfamily)